MVTKEERAFEIYCVLCALRKNNKLKQIVRFCRHRLNVHKSTWNYIWAEALLWQVLWFYRFAQFAFLFSAHSIYKKVLLKLENVWCAVSLLSRRFNCDAMRRWLHISKLMFKHRFFTIFFRYFFLLALDLSLLFFYSTKKHNTQQHWINKKTASLLGVV